VEKTYSTTPSDVKEAALDDETLCAIGRLIRGFAEIEDLITLYICRLGGLSESQCAILLGRTAISRRLEIARDLAIMAGTAVATTHESIFDSNFFSLLNCRNTFAHGTFLGTTDDGDLAFLTVKSDDIRSNDGKYLRIVESYNSQNIIFYAKTVEESISKIEQVLVLKETRSARHNKALGVHRKASASGVHKRK
jgi:hypothetical protein